MTADTARASWRLEVPRDLAAVNLGFRPVRDLFIRYRRYEDNGYVIRLFRLIDNVIVDTECARRANECKALNHRAPIKSETQQKSPWVGHPAARFCIEVGGVATEILLGQHDNSQSSFCVFEDGSRADSWDLLGRHQKKTKEQER